MPHSVNGTRPTMSEQASAPDPNAQGHAEWTDVETRYFDDIRRMQQKEDDEAEYQYQVNHARILNHLHDARRVKTNLEDRLRAANDRLAAQETRLASLISERQNRVADLAVSRKKHFYDMQEYFKRNRDEGTELDFEAVKALYTLPAHAKVNTQVASANGDPGVDDIDSTSAEGGEHENPEEPTGASVWQVDGTLLGEIMRLPREIPAARILLGLPIKRKIDIRPGRKFSEENLKAIYEPTRGTTKYPRWTACMIQAVGEVAAAPCHNCSRNHGAFSSCVKLEGELFPRCANCEFTRQGCHPGPRQTAVQENGAEAAETTVNSVEEVAGEAAVSTDTDVAEPSNRPGATAEKTRRQSASVSQRRKSSKNITNSLTSTPGGDDTAGGKADAPAYTWTDDDMHPDKLTSPAIPFKHDGNVYTYPEFMEGVPLEKITPDHPFWDPKWKDPVETTRVSLAANEAKYQESLSQDISPERRYLKYINLRQVRRGRAILEFLQDGPINPYQLVSKRFMQPNVVQYDTLYRLVKTLEELAEFCIKVSPLDWLRHRLYEIQVDVGDAFNLRTVLKDIYHDRKVAALRVLSGKPSVGRPVIGGDGAGTGSPKKRKRNRGKRKEGPSVGDGSPRPAKRSKVDVDADEDRVRAQLQALVEEQGRHEAESELRVQAQTQTHTQAESEQVSFETETETRAKNRDQQQQDVDDMVEAQEKAIEDGSREQLREGAAGQQAMDQLFQEQRELTLRAARAAGEKLGQSPSNDEEPARDQGDDDDDDDDGSFTDTDSVCGESLDGDDFRVRQVCSREYMSPEGSLQYWHATSFENALSLDLHHLRHGEGGSRAWTMYEDPVNLNLAIEDVLRVAYHPDSLVVHVATRDRRGALMALLKRGRTKRRLLDFWRENGKEFTLMDPDALMEEWDRMAQTAAEVTDVE